MASIAQRICKLSPIALSLMTCLFSVQTQAYSYKDTAPVPTTQPMATHTVNLLPTSTTLGLMMGFIPNNRVGTVNSTVVAGGTPGNFHATGSNTNVDAEAGLQIKLVYDLYGKAQPFVYINAVGIIGANNNMRLGFVNSSAQSSSTVIAAYDWIARLGIQTELLFNQLQFGAGLGAAFLNQTINAYIAESSTSIFSNHHLSAAPTLMVDMTWQACRNCIADHPFSVSLQGSFDHNPSLSVNGTTPSGNTYQSSINQKWIPHFDLVLNILS